MIKVYYSDFIVEEYANVKDVEDGILEAFAEGVFVEEILDDEDNYYSCIWTVKLQKES
uniref:Uncharacterized protein n=1 Tax=viral metagenome TaxID=1070528 RepID=A0A6M3LEE7_9ZZZZ